MVPRGLHFVHFGSGMGPRQGFFFYTDGNELIVRSWDKVNEEITPNNILSEESTRELWIAIQRGHLNDQLGLYPYDQHHYWTNLTSSVTTDVLQRANCALGSSIISCASTHNNNDFSEENSVRCVPKFAHLIFFESKLKEALNNGKRAEKGSALTALFMDKSRILEELMVNYFERAWSNLLGEAQLAFILFLLLLSADALEHWKSITHMISSSETVLKSNPLFAADFVKTFHTQLNFSPREFFDMELSKEMFLRPTLSALFGSLFVEGNDLPEPLAECIHRLLKFVSKKFNIYSNDLNLDYGENYNLVAEDMPVIVSGHNRNIDEECGVVSSSALQTESEAMLINIQDKWDQNLPSEKRASPATLESVEFEIQQPVAVNCDPKQAISPQEMEIELFRWRYPLLYEAMLDSAGREDMIMTAARVIETYQSPEHCKRTLREAEFYLEHEGSR